MQQFGTQSQQPQGVTLHQVASRSSGSRRPARDTTGGATTGATTIAGADGSHQSSQAPPPCALTAAQEQPELEPEPEPEPDIAEGPPEPMALEAALQALHARAEQLGHDYGITSRDIAVEAVEPEAHRRLLAGELAEWKQPKPDAGWQGEASDNPFKPSTRDNLLSKHGWVAEAVPGVRGMVGRVWEAAHTHERGYKRWMHKWHVVELEPRQRGPALVLRIHEYNFDKG